MGIGSQFSLHKRIRGLKGKHEHNAEELQRGNRNYEKTERKLEDPKDSDG